MAVLPFIILEMLLLLAVVFVPEIATARKPDSRFNSNLYSFPCPKLRDWSYIVEHGRSFPLYGTAAKLVALQDRA